MKRFYLYLFLCFFAFTLIGQPSEKKLRFAFLTDIHLNASNSRDRLNGLKQALDKTKDLNVDFIITGGDQLDVSGGSSKNYINKKAADSLYTVLKHTFDAQGLTYYPTIGNHDRYWDTEKGFVKGDELFKKYFKDSYYTFEKSGVRFFILNSVRNGGETGYEIDVEQMQWLQNNLKDVSKETPIVVSTHVPFYSLYYPLVEDKYVFIDVISNYKEVLKAFKPYNLQLVLQGHQHIHEEIKIQNVQFVTGGAVCAGWWRGAFHGTEEGFLLVEVDRDNNFSWEYVDYGWIARE